MKSASVEKSFEFAIRIVKLHKYLSNEKKEYVLSKQLLRCGTSIGANVSEAQRGQTMPDFTTKMCIALKEANETYYWLKLLYKTSYLTETEFYSMESDVKEVIAILTSICKKTNNNN